MSKIFLGKQIWLPPASHVPSGIYRCGIIHPVKELYSLVSELISFFDEISILFNENGEFTLEKLYSMSSSKKTHLQFNYAETFAFALAKDKKFQAAYELYSLIAKNGYVVSVTKKENLIHYPSFGNEKYEFGVLGLYYFAKTCIRLGKIEEGKEIINNMIISVDFHKNFDYDRQTLDLLIKACELFAKNEISIELINFFKQKKEGLKKLLPY
ncbi:MAG: hypothetical protein KBD14_02470 [Candidatus Pacebacteria bacterium]|nr:hypothetical protein [Candidatus Paceibacterota bacterium]